MRQLLFVRAAGERGQALTSEVVALALVAFAIVGAVSLVQRFL
jgi:hypothetical protein